MRLNDWRLGTHFFTFLKAGLGHIWGMSQENLGDNSGRERAVAIRP